MNEQPTDKILDSFLEEMLAGQSPPDLTERIQEAWRLECEEAKSQGEVARRPLIHAELVEESEAPTQSPTSPSKQSSQSVARSSNRSALGHSNRAVQPARVVTNGATKPSDRRWVVATGLALVASFVLIGLGVQAVFWGDIGGNNVAAVNGSGTGTVDAPTNPVDTPLVSGTDAAMELAENPKRESFAPEELFPSDAESVLNPGQRDSAPESQVAFADRAIVKEMDRRMEGIWSEVGVPPGEKLVGLPLAEKMFAELAGQEMPADVRKSILERKLAPRSVSDRVSRTAFADHWAKKVTRDWLQRGSLPLDSESVLAFEDVVERKILKAQPWNQMPGELLGGDISGNTEEAGLTSVFVSSLAGSKNHRLARRISSQFLNQNLACVQCHDGTMRGGAIAGRAASGKQSQYWSLVAMLNGLDARGNGFKGQRKAFDRQAELFGNAQQPEVFYDLLDGRVRTARAVLPSGESWKQTGETLPRQALGNWLARSTDFDRAVVNQTWKMVFGRFLVPQVSGVDVIAIESRRELLDLLAAQFRAHDHDLGKLVVWMVSSDAFSRDSASLSADEWLEVTDEQLETMQLQELVFASGPTIGKSKESRNFETSLAAVLDWTNPQNDSGASATLAQPDLRVNRLKSKQQAKPRVDASSVEIAMPSLGFVLHGDRHTKAERAYVDRLIASDRLSWKQRVQHVVLLGESSSASPRVQELAQSLLVQNDNDEQETLLDLLWSVRNADAN